MARFGLSTKQNFTVEQRLESKSNTYYKHQYINLDVHVELFSIEIPRKSKSLINTK